ncbi:MAG TPA: histidine kinase [Solirubrobacteraceae bacterium]
MIAVVSGIVIALELFRPFHSVDPGARAALETAIAVVAILTARLLMEAFDRSRQMRELLLLSALLTASLSDFGYWAGPALTGVRSPTSGAARLACELIGALAFAAAAFAPHKAIAERRRRLAKFATVLGVGSAVLGALLVQVILVDGGASAENAGTVSAANHPVALGVHATSAAILAVAAFAFVAGSWRAESGNGLLAGGCLLLAGANLQFLAIPAVATDWVTPREGARLAAYAFLLGGVYLRYAKLRRYEAYVAICSERKRIACDLHDGLAQDLACIAAQGQRLGCELGPEHPLMLATRDALAMLRGTIADLTASTAPTPEAALRLIAHELGHRFDVQVDVRIEAGSPLRQGSRRELAQRDDLIRTAREGIVNAAVHGSSRHIDVELLRRRGTLVVRVSGDGPEIPDGRPAGFGLRRKRSHDGSRFSAQRRRPARRRHRA